MKKENEKLLIFVVFSLIFGMLIIGLVSAGSCLDDDRIMKLSSSTNSHGALWNFSSGGGGGGFFGNQNIGSTFSSLQPIGGGIYTAPQDGYIENITADYIDWTSGKRVKCAIYDENRNLISSTQERSDGGNDWQTFNFASPVSVSAGTDYSLVCWADSVMAIVSESGAPVTNYFQSTAYGTWPSFLGPPSSSWEKSIYASYGSVTSYDYEICYLDIFGAVYDGDLATVHDCTGTNKVLGLYNVSNSHAEIPEETVYTNDVCYGNLVCINITDPSPCPADYKTVVRLYNETNSHISNASDSNYLIKICCKSAPTGNVYWADMQGNPITDAEIGDSVLMIYQDMAGQSYDFEVWENDRLFDDYIRSVTESFDFGVDLAAKWVITQEDWEKDIISDPEFVFVVDGITSENLIVPEDSFDNSAPLTQIIKPVAETDYVIRQGDVSTNTISFEQISSDIDDDLKITWNFGGGETSLGFENCSSGTNCNTTHQYTTSGTKNIILTASEMAPRTPAQFIKDSSRIYVYDEGITAFVVMDYAVNERMVTIDVTQTHVSDCDYVQATCEGKYGSGNCYQIIDEINPADFVWCYDLVLRVDGIDSDPNLYLDWTADGVAFTPNRIGNEMKYIKIFDEPGDHIINLGVRYKL